MAKKKIARPNRDPDHYSKRDVPYWWAPEWIRGTSADIKYCNGYKAYSLSDLTLSDGTTLTPCDNYGKIRAVKTKNNKIELNMLSKDGNLSFIQGSIQVEFKKWHEDRHIDYLLLGEDPDNIIKDLTLEEN
jgi:hypothetical protein